MSEVKYLKFVDVRRGKTNGKVLSMFRETDDKYALVNSSGEWEDAPGLKTIFSKHKSTGNYFPATEKDANDFIAAKKPKKKQKTKPETEEILETEIIVADESPES
jgi:hypothetical protein